MALGCAAQDDVELGQRDGDADAREHAVDDGRRDCQADARDTGRAMPSDSGMATRKTTSDASTSWRTDENNRGRVAWGEASGAMVGMDMATLHYGGPLRTRHDGTDRIDVMIR